MDTESNALPDAKTLFERMCIDGTRFQAQKFLSAVENYEGLSEAINQGEESTSNYLPAAIGRLLRVLSKQGTAQTESSPRKPKKIEKLWKLRSG